MHVQVLSFVLQRHHLLGFAGHGLEPPQASSCRLLGLLRRSESQQVVQVVGQVVGLWIINSERGGRQGQELRTRDTVGRKRFQICLLCMWKRGMSMPVMGRQGC